MFHYLIYSFAFSKNEIKLRISNYPLLLSQADRETMRKYIKTCLKIFLIDSVKPIFSIFVFTCFEFLSKNKLESFDQTKCHVKRATCAPRWA